MRDNFENEPKEETTARPDVPERTMEEHFKKLICETAEAILGEFCSVSYEEIGGFCPEDSSEDALDELEERIEELLLATYGADLDCTECGARAKECVQAIILPYCETRERHVVEVEDFITHLESLDHDAYNDALKASETHARKAAQQMSLMLGAEPKSA